VAKRTAVIDIGSNSVRVVIYERTSRFAFHLLRQAKSRVRIGEGVYKQDGHLTDSAMQRAFETLQEYVTLAETYKCRKILSVATSALRDAPNKSVFINKVSKELGINLKVIDGDQEAYLGGIAALNMLAMNQGVTIDIGGGSTELAIIDQGRVTQTVSLNIGTVRLKELFLNDSLIDDAKAFILDAAKTLDKTFFKQNIIGIGGSIRALSNAYLKEVKYPIKVLHGYSYKASKMINFATPIITANEKYLKDTNIKSERFDVIGSGALIFTELLKYLNAPTVTVSSVGVREGTYLKDFLRTQNDVRFPHAINPSMRSLTDRYIPDEPSAKLLKKCAHTLFDLLHERLELPMHYREIIGIAAQLSEIGIELNYYDYERHSFYLILHSLYGFTHEDTLLIATLVRYQSKKKPSKSFRDKYDDLLPSGTIMKALIFILGLSHAMLVVRPPKIPFEMSFEDDCVVLKSLDNNHLAIEKIERMSHFLDVKII
jgi:exopolyphosphatase / guanosine-5'-triphosphate,3'-diphosphate pyrophosphatase